jgi:hypothetical protein
MRRIVIVIGLFVLAACGGGGSSTPFVGAPTPATSATPTPATSASPTSVVTATPTPAPLAVTPPSLQFTATGYALPFAATEAGYAGALTATSSDCTGVATFSPANGVGPSASFAVTSVAAGKCHMTITDAANQKSVVTVDVTTLSGTIQ